MFLQMETFERFFPVLYKVVQTFSVMNSYSATTQLEAMKQREQNLSLENPKLKF